MPIGRKAGSIKELKASLKKGGAGGTFIKYIPKNSSITVRFLQEPEEWVNFYEHYDTNLKKSYPCLESASCPGCITEERRTSRYLANALDVDTDRVIPLQLPKDLVNSLVNIYSKVDTMMDRDYELIRSGEGLDTTYTPMPEPPFHRKLAKYEPHDLQQVLDDAFQNTVGGGVPDKDDESPILKGIRKKSVAVAAMGDQEEDDEEDTDSDVDDEDTDADADADADVDVDVDEEEEPDDDEDVDDDAAASDDDDDEELLTEEDIRAMSLKELRTTARDLGIDPKGLKPPQIIDAIMALAE